MFVYISGKIRGNENYYADFKKAELWLKLKDYAVINPAKVVESLPLTKMSESQIMKIDYALIDVCDAIFMLDCWQKSKGACAELSYAKSIGKKVMYQDYFKEFKKKGVEYVY